MCATHGEPVCTGGGVCGMAVTAQAMRARRGGISGDLSGLAWTQTHHPTNSVWCIDAEWRACAWTECVQTSVLNHRAVKARGARDRRGDADAGMICWDSCGHERGRA